MKLRLVLVTLFVSAFWIAGCSALTPPTPTPTPAPTDVPTVAPTATTAATAVPPTAANPLPQAIGFALTKSQGAHSLKYDFNQTLTFVQDGKTQVLPVLSLKGVDSTLNRQVTLSGTTSDTHEQLTYDVVVLGQDVYIKGINGVTGVDPKQWYQLPPEAQQGVRQLPSAIGLLASFTPAEMGKAEFASTGSESLNNQTCTVWTAKNDQFAQALIGLTPDSDLTKQMGTIDLTEVKLWTCADGYINQLTGNVVGHQPDNKANTATLALHFLMSNFDEALKVDAPTGALPFPTQPPQATETGAAGSPTGAAGTPSAGATATGAATPTTAAAKPTASPTP